MSSGDEIGFSSYKESNSFNNSSSLNENSDGDFKSSMNHNGLANNSLNHSSKSDTNHISSKTKDGHHHSHKDKHKEKSHHSSSNHKHSSSHKTDSSSTKHKDKSSSGHHKSSTNGDVKKDSSSKHNSSSHKSSGEKHKSSHHHGDGSSKSHKSSHGDKHKSESSKHKSSSSGDKHKKDGERHHHKSKHKDKNKEKHRTEEPKVKPEPKIEPSLSQSPDIKRESSFSPNNDLVIKEEPFSQNDVSSPSQERELVINTSIKSNDSMSDDDLPLTARKVKREREDDDSEEDEPLASRAAKAKKQKSSSKKRKVESDDDSDADSDYGKKIKPKKKKIKKEDTDFEDEDVKPKKKSSTQKKPKKEESSSKTPTKKKAKQKEEEQDVWKWWEEEKMDDGQKWRSLSHKGPVFAPPYEVIPSSVKFYYNGKHMKLSQDTEEVAGFYGRMLSHDYVTKESFNKNFFKDWRKCMTQKEKDTITDLTKCDFREIDEYYKMKSEERKAMSKEEKLVLRKQNEDMLNEYGFCVIDNHKQKIGNFKIEPPGLFRGRGEHPKMGMLKKRIYPEDIIINIGKEAEIPKAPDGHKWKEIRHDNTVTWLASWNENILGQTKYIMLNPSSKLKGEKDWAKYETARKLKTRAPKIREDYQAEWKSKEMKARQRSVALYFIDRLALRAGNEKEEGETADTVGCCSLRVEHIKLHKEKDGKEYVVDFDFLGKDSIRYENSVPVEKQVFKNLKLFMESKKPGDDLFDRLNTTILNKHLNELMEGLTAKVFRTYNASKTLQEQLDLLTKEKMSQPEILLAYNRANRAVAILCNHQRSVPKTFSKQMENLQKKIEDKEEQISQFKKDLKDLKNRDRTLFEKKKKRLQQLDDQLKKLEVQQTDKEENKQIALGTSKLNYLDPRISVAWCKKWDVPIEKIYNKTQRDKFRWAIEMANKDYKF